MHAIHNAHDRLLALPAPIGFAIILATVLAAKLVATFAFGLAF